jgi:hypothetical protein
MLDLGAPPKGGDLDRAGEFWRLMLLLQPCLEDA